ncbi:hypothetical protein ES288_D10G095000v1 [Gossypium darwinii]|uniref:Uncharacterized protein n=1 Tax=Gossypium darwinii TaxID=34276 RepID=A0A5D2AX25_GOSDA|nr:hypothetical protein ES288_D10G095000v1 [Gossypium darwinii]
MASASHGEERSGTSIHGKVNDVGELCLAISVKGRTRHQTLGDELADEPEAVAQIALGN